MEVSCTALHRQDRRARFRFTPERFDPKTTRRPSGENCAPSSSRVEEMETTGREGRGTPGAGVWQLPDIPVGGASDVDQSGRRPEWGRETTGISPSSPTKGSRAGALSPCVCQPPKTLAGGEKNLLALGRPGRTRGILRGEGEAFGWAGGSEIVLERKPVKLRTGAARVALEDQRPTIRSERWVETPSTEEGDAVSCLLSPVSSDTTNNAIGFPSP